MRFYCFVLGILCVSCGLNKSIEQRAHLLDGDSLDKEDTVFLLRDSTSQIRFVSTNFDGMTIIKAFARDGSAVFDTTIVEGGIELHTRSNDSFMVIYFSGIGKRRHVDFKITNDLLSSDAALESVDTTKEFLESRVILGPFFKYRVSGGITEFGRYCSCFDLVFRADSGEYKMIDTEIQFVRTGVWKYFDKTGAVYKRVRYLQNKTIYIRKGNQ